MMITYAAIPLTCWLCTLLTVPHAPRAGDEVQELIYRRLLGRHHLLRAGAIAATLAASFALVVHAVTRGLA